MDERAPLEDGHAEDASPPFISVMWQLDCVRDGWAWNPGALPVVSDSECDRMT
jgi:hypothetical protein